jgi:plastocyanin
MKLVALTVVVTALAATTALAAPAAPVAGKTLIGTDGPGFTITLTQGGKKVTSLKAGTYTFKISDKSNIHNFHLTGPGVNKKTSVGAVQKATWKVKLKKGTYKYVCDPHVSIMHGSFTVK